MKRKHTSKKSANRSFNKRQVLSARNPFTRLFIKQMNDAQEKVKAKKQKKKKTERT